MLDPTSTLGTLAFDNILVEGHASSALPSVASPAGLPTTAAAIAEGAVAMPSAAALQTTAEVAGEVQRSIENAVRADTGGAPVGRGTRGGTKSVEIATQIASILVFTHGLLNSDLEAAGSRPFDLPKVAAADLDRLLNSRRLVERLATSGGDRDACAIAAARIDAAIERLEILVGIVGSKVGEVRQMIAAVGLKSDIDPFKTAIDSLLARMRTVREASKSISAPPANGVAAMLIRAANAATDMFQQSIEAVVDAIDGAALAGALGGGEMAPSPAASNQAPGDIAVEPGNTAAMHVAALLGSSQQAQRWLDLLARDHGSLAAAASHYELDASAQLKRMVEMIAARSYDPLTGVNRTLGGNINHLFGSEARVLNTSAQSVRLHAGNLQFEQKTYRVIDALERPERPDIREDKKLEAHLLAARRTVLLGEVVIEPGKNAPPGSRPPRKALASTLPRLIGPPGTTTN